MGHDPHAKAFRLTPQIEIAIGAFFLAIGSAGPPLELPRIALAVLVCAALSLSGRFIGALTMVAVIACSWLQHGEFRMTSLIGAAALGVAAHFFYRRPRAATLSMAVAAVGGLTLLFLG